MRLWFFLPGKSFAQLKGVSAYQKWIEGGFEAAPPGGESGVGLLSRVLGGVQQIFSRMMAEHLTDIAVVTHGGVIMSPAGRLRFPQAGDASMGHGLRRRVHDLINTANVDAGPGVRNLR